MKRPKVSFFSCGGSGWELGVCLGEVSLERAAVQQFTRCAWFITLKDYYRLGVTAENSINSISNHCSHSTLSLLSLFAQNPLF